MIGTVIAMTTPPPPPPPITPPGWYADAQGEVRWWDGNDWTGQTQAQLSERKVRNKRILIGVGAVAAALVVIGALASGTSESPSPPAPIAAPAEPPAAIESPVAPPPDARDARRVLLDAYGVKSFQQYRREANPLVAFISDVEIYNDSWVRITVQAANLTNEEKDPLLGSATSALYCTDFTAVQLYDASGRDVGFRDVLACE